MTVFGIENSLCQFLSVFKDLIVIMISDMRVFGILVWGSVTFVFAGFLQYVWYFIKVKLDKQTESHPYLDKTATTGTLKILYVDRINEESSYGVIYKGNLDFGAKQWRRPSTFYSPMSTGLLWPKIRGAREKAPFSRCLFWHTSCCQHSLCSGLRNAGWGRCMSTVLFSIIFN